jgi:hypothetical protein
MSILKPLAACVLAITVVSAQAGAQESASPGNPAKPTEHVLGTITAVDAVGHTITVKDDKTSTESGISLASTRTLLKVEPGARDLKNATRITAGDLAVGDRVDVRGFKSESGGTAIAARSVVLMSARDLQQKHQADVAAWQNSTAGTVTAVNPTAMTMTINAKTAEGAKSILVQASPASEFTRYSPENPKVPTRSDIKEIQPPDQVRVIGSKSDDGATIHADRIYSGAFRTIAATVTSVSPDGKGLTVKDLQTKQPVEIALTDQSAIRKLPPMMAMGLARRFNPSLRPVDAANGAGGQPGREQSGAAGGAPVPAGNAQPDGEASQRTPGTQAGAVGQGGGGGHAVRNGDLSHLLERAPQIGISELKPGDALVISGAQDKDKTHIIASTVIAGVEPIFQSASPRQGQSLGDWSLDMAVPAQ